ncbi:MAG: OmpH family outer membrane protein [Saprospiraceae bacterium]
MGYINSTDLLMLHPDVKSADSLLNDYQNQLLQEGQKLVDDFQKNYQAYVKDANEGNLSKIQMAEQENDLTEQQNKIRDYETDMQQKDIEKREDIYQPILDKIQMAINEVGIENQYTFIFDSAQEEYCLLIKVTTFLNW